MVDVTYEELLKRTILPELEVGRPNFDRPHTEAVVYYIKEIIMNNPGLDLDRDVLIIAAYAHDWGYSGLFKKGKPIEIDDVAKAKKNHMTISVSKLKELLKSHEFGFLSDERKERAIHLVEIHDELDVLKDNDEFVLMEADTLGGLDVSMLKPTFNKISNTKYMKNVKTKRYPLFFTEYGKEKFKKLYKSRKAYYKER